jgi:hypothetical protein
MCEINLKYELHYNDTERNEIPSITICHGSEAGRFVLELTIWSDIQELRSLKTDYILVTRLTI